MIKEIKYNGFSASPSDYDSLDGDLACAMGVIPEDGALRPVPSPTIVLSLEQGQSVIKIHTTSSYEHYLIMDINNRLYWRTKETAINTPMADFVGREVMQVECIGNTVLVLCDDGIHYLLWSPHTLNYTYLGNKLPECPISFGLQGTPVRSDDFKVTYNNLETDASNGFDHFLEVSKENQALLTEQVMAKVNSFIAENATNKGKFILPFFVRYAYRLYDETLTHHSSPILMLPTTSSNPLVPIVNGFSNTEATARVFAVAAELNYHPIASADTFKEIAKWKDIIKSVDVFISAPIYTFNQSANIKRFGTMYDFTTGDFYGKLETPQQSQFVGSVADNTYYNIHNYNSIYRSLNNIGNSSADRVYQISLPEKSVEDINADITNCAQFYYLTSIETEHLHNERKKITIPNDYLQSLTTREVMTDDYQSHDSLRPKSVFVYNSRINIANVERELFKGYDTAAMVAYINRTDKATTTEKMHLYTSLNTSDGNYMVKNSSSLALAQDARVFRFLFYPDTTASRMMVRPTGLDGETEIENGMTALFVPYKNAPLRPHAFLNGAIYFDGFANNGWSSPFTGYTLQDSTPIVDMPNKIYTSEVKNPFLFPLSGINTIGTGEIIGMATAAKALSEGQYGQFPLYAFTSDGVWAMKVSAKGGFLPEQPITRDVCISKDSITPIDNTVLFLTDRGVMLMSGSNSLCISNILDGKEQFSMWELPYAEQLITKANIYESAFEVIPFKEYIRNARMIYDYINQRVLLYNSNRSYTYVYSLESKAWGMYNANISNSVNSYPNALAMTTDAKLVDFSQLNTIQGFKGLIVTRPLKLDTPDELKTVNTVIQRGHFSKGSVQSILYGSRDLINWRLIASSKDHYLRGFSGTPYKYFRIALICNLEDKESISGCSIQYIPKLTNKLR